MRLRYINELCFGGIFAYSYIARHGESDMANQEFPFTTYHCQSLCELRCFRRMVIPKLFAPDLRVFQFKCVAR